MKEWERNVCDEISTVGWTLDPPGDFWMMVEVAFLGALAEKMLSAGKYQCKADFDASLAECRSLAAVLARCAAPSYDPERDRDCPEGWKRWNPSRVLGPLPPQQRARIIDLLGYLLHHLVDRFAGTWGDPDRFKAAVAEAFEVCYWTHGLVYDLSWADCRLYIPCGHLPGPAIVPHDPRAWEGGIELGR